MLPQRYVFSSKSQQQLKLLLFCLVVIATTKVRIFKQITTDNQCTFARVLLLLLPQRYVFSSKSQRYSVRLENLQGCYCYHKGTYFQANHNKNFCNILTLKVVVATTRARIFKRITMGFLMLINFKKRFRFWSLILIIYLCIRS